MIKKIAFGFILFAVNSLYPTKVWVKNMTPDTVWVRVNENKKQVRKPRTSFMIELNLALGGRSRPTTTLSCPDFIDIKSGDRIEMKADNTNINKLTFLRIKGQKEIKGTVEELEKKVDEITLAYGNILFLKGTKGAIYNNPFIPETSRKWKYKKGKEYSITVPIFESFVLDFGNNPIKPEDEMTRVDLEDWRKAKIVEWK